MKSSIHLAEKIAREAFADKVDLADKPYIEHLERVSSTIANKPGMDAFIAAAWLHDLLEDCSEWQESDLRKLFAANIVDTIILLTKKTGQDYVQYISSLKGNIGALEIKKADLEDNLNLSRLQKVTEKDILRLEKYREVYKLVVELINEYYNSGKK